jgi:hypothetical protein
MTMADWSDAGIGARFKISGHVPHPDAAIATIA